MVFVAISIFIDLQLSDTSILCINHRMMHHMWYRIILPCTFPQMTHICLNTIKTKMIWSEFTILDKIHFSFIFFVYLIFFIKIHDFAITKNEKFLNLKKNLQIFKQHPVKMHSSHQMTAVILTGTMCSIVRQRLGSAKVMEFTRKAFTIWVWIA